MADGFGPFLQPGIPSRMIPCRGYDGAFAVLRAKAPADCGLPDAQRSFQTLAPEPALSVHADNQPYIRHRILIPVVCVGTSAAGIFARFVCIAASVRLRDGCRGFVAGSLCFRVRVVVVSWPVCRVFKAGGRGGAGKVLFPAERLRSGGVELGEGPSLSALGFLFRLSALPPGAASILRVDCPVAE